MSCDASYQCPAPLLDDADAAPLAACSGRGSCLPAAAAAAAGVPTPKPAGCSCDAGWGDEGCGTAVTPLSGGAWISATIMSGYWAYYTLQVRCLCLGRPCNVLDSLQSRTEPAGYSALTAHHLLGLS